MCSGRRRRCRKDLFIDLLHYEQISAGVRSHGEWSLVSHIATRCGMLVSKGHRPDGSSFGGRVVEGYRIAFVA